MRLYHVTPKRNSESIALNGVDPSYATGRLPGSWWVDWTNLQWAIIHVGTRYNVAIRQICVVRANLYTVKKFTKGVYRFEYCTNLAIKFQTASGINEAVHAGVLSKVKWLDRDEWRMWTEGGNDDE